MLGCMAERLRDRLLDREKLADLVVGPDAYRDLPNLLEKIKVDISHRFQHSPARRVPPRHPAKDRER